MSAEEKNNNLDDFFRSRLSEQGDEAWNLPSDRVFEGAMAQIAQQRKRRWLFWLILAALAIGFASFVYWSLHTIQGLEQELSILKQTQLETPKDASVAQIQKPTTDFERINKAAAEESTSAVKNSLLVQTFTPESIVNDVILSPDIPEDDRPTEVGLTVNQQMLDAKEAKPAGEPLIESKKDKPISTFTVPQNDDAETEAQNTTAIAKNTKDSTIRSVSTKVYLIAGSNWSSLGMTANNPLPNNLKEYDNWYTGYQYGLGLSQSKGPATLFAELSLSQAVNKSVFKDQAVYSKQNEFINSNGDPIYATNLDFDSPVLPFSQDVSFEASGKNLNEGDTMDSKMFIENTFHLISLDAGLQWEVLSKGKSTFSALAAAGINLISELEQDVRLDLYRSESLIGQQIGDLNTGSLYNRWVPSVQIGVAYNYKFNSFDLGLRTTYGTSLRSIREVDPANGIKTQMQLIRSNIILAYTF